MGIFGLQAGEEVKIIGPDQARGDKGGQRNYQYRANYEHMALFLSLQLTKEDKIDELDFSPE